MKAGMPLRGDRCPCSAQCPESISDLYKNTLLPIHKKKVPVLVGQLKAEPCSEDNLSGGITFILLLGEVQSQVST